MKPLTLLQAVDVYFESGGDPATLEQLAEWIVAHGHHSGPVERCKKSLAAAVRRATRKKIPLGEDDEITRC
jgi:hypothetical protein